MFRFSRNNSSPSASIRPVGPVPSPANPRQAQHGRVLAQASEPVPAPAPARQSGLETILREFEGTKAAPASAVEKVPAPPTKPFIHVAESPAPLEEVDEITTLNNVPAGDYVNFASLSKPIPASFGLSMAVLQTEKEAFVVVTKESRGGHAYYELRKRLLDNGLQFNGISYQATEEVIRALHEKYATGNEAGLQTSTEKLAEMLIIDAYERGTSDIHIETVGKSEAKVLHRIHGERVQRPSISYSNAMKIANVFYNAWADTQNKKASWDATAVMETVIERTMPDGKAVQLRFESTPIHPSGNFQIVMRLLRMDEQKTRPFTEMGYLPAMVQSIDDMTSGSTGLVILVGPVNSGKSTTQQALLQRTREHRGQTIKIVTVEDPVEYLVEGACQIGVPKGRKNQEDDSGNNFQSLLKATLRLDPDVVMIGEIRSTEVASVVKDGVLTGKKYFSTIHASDSFTVFTRLRELGIPDSVLTSAGFLSGIIYQRLLPQVCPHCSVPLRQANDEGLLNQNLLSRLLSVIDLTKDEVRVRRRNTESIGCQHCNYLGIIGRRVCAELVVPDKSLLGYMQRGEEAEAKAYWDQTAKHRIETGVSAMAHAIYIMRQGLVDPVDVEINLGPIRADDFQVAINMQRP